MRFDFATDDRIGSVQTAQPVMASAAAVRIINTPYNRALCAKPRAERNRGPRSYFLQEGFWQTKRDRSSVAVFRQPAFFRLRFEARCGLFALNNSFVGM